jgi:hypothetical protein
MSQLKKLEREQKFNLDEFNKKFEESDMIQEEKFIKQPEQPIKYQKIPENINYTENFGINMKNLFFEILEILMNKENPIPYIINNKKKVFLVTMMILIISILLLFWSNLIINK